jgi:hypothetical protein
VDGSGQKERSVLRIGRQEDLTIVRIVAVVTVPLTVAVLAAKAGKISRWHVIQTRRTLENRPTMNNDQIGRDSNCRPRLIHPGCTSMSAHRFSNLLAPSESVSTPWNWMPAALSPFATLPATTLAGSPAAVEIYRAAFDAARRQLARRSLLFTWNARQN